jgi:hypothetical protein
MPRGLRATKKNHSQKDRLIIKQRNYKGIDYVNLHKEPLQIRTLEDLEEQIQVG